jgi:hypothetical protein
MWRDSGIGRIDIRIHEVSPLVAVYIAVKRKIREQNHE